MTYTQQQVIQTVLKVLEELDKSDVTKLSLEEKKKLASDNNTSPETLTLLASDEHHDVLYWVARNPNTTPETLTFLAKDKYFWTRRGIASNPNTPPETLTLLASDEDHVVCWEVAQNPNTPSETLTHLASDKDGWVRKNAKQNPNYNPTETVTLTKQQKEAIQNLIDSSQDENLKDIKL